MSDHPLGTAKVTTFLVTSSAEKAKAFYGGVLGLKFISEDAFALVFETDGRMLRISPVKRVTPAQHTVLGWDVADITAAVTALKARGIEFTIYDGMDQDPAGIWSAPGSTAKVAWFKDPDGNVLSVAQHQ